MDVQCERCKTEYEFDDALVSGRGTTVRCTTCGHQFKVHLAGPSGSEPPQDKWVVQLSSGSHVTYLTLRELQRAIVARQVSRGDSLVRPGAPVRRLGSIAELEPFFDGRASTKPPPPATPGSEAKPLPQVPPAPLLPHISRAPDQRAPSPSMNSGGRGQWGDLSPAAPPTSRKPTPLGYAAGTGAPAPPPLRSAPPPPLPSTPPPPVRARTISRPPEFDIESSNPVSLPGTDYALEPESSRGSAPPPAAPPQSSRRPALAPADPYAFGAPPAADPMADAMTDAIRVPQRFDSEAPYTPKRRGPGWIVFGVLLGGVVVVGGLVARPYLASTPPAPVPNAKGLALVQEGEAALSDGDLELAQQDFDKASVLSESDPKVAVDLARVAVAAADVAWLRVRLTAQDAEGEQRAAQQQLTDRLGRARKAVEAAAAAAPNEPSSIRAKADLLRMSGDLEAARRQLGRLSSDSSADTAYTTGAMELAETSPSWSHAADKLRSAANGEGRAGRARSALVYALVEGGDTAAAQTELTRLGDLPRTHPLFGLLRAYAAKAKRSPDGGPAARGTATPVSQLPTAPPAPEPYVPSGALPVAPPVAPPATPPVAPPPVAAGGGGGGGGGGVASGGTFNGPIPSDPRIMLEQAESAKRKRDWTRAKTLYNALVERNPSDSEALAGQADVAKAQGDLSGAAAGYKRAIGVNPSYLPALLGLADSLWDAGDKTTAVRRYKEIVDRFPEGTYPAAVKTRVEAPPPSTPASDPAPTKEPAGADPAKSGAKAGDETP